MKTLRSNLSKNSLKLDLFRVDEHLIDSTEIAKITLTQFKSNNIVKPVKSKAKKNGTQKNQNNQNKTISLMNFFCGILKKNLGFKNYESDFPKKLKENVVDSMNLIDLIFSLWGYFNFYIFFGTESAIYIFVSEIIVFIWSIINFVFKLKLNGKNKFDITYLIVNLIIIFGNDMIINSKYAVKIINLLRLFRLLRINMNSKKKYKSKIKLFCFFLAFFNCLMTYEWIKDDNREHAFIFDHSLQWSLGLFLLSYNKNENYVSRNEEFPVILIQTFFMICLLFIFLKLQGRILKKEKDSNNNSAVKKKPNLKPKYVITGIHDPILINMIVKILCKDQKPLHDSFYILSENHMSHKHKNLLSINQKEFFNLYSNKTFKFNTKFCFFDRNNLLSLISDKNYFSKNFLCFDSETNDPNNFINFKKLESYILSNMVVNPGFTIFLKNFLKYEIIVEPFPDPFIGMDFSEIKKIIYFSSFYSSNSKSCLILLGIMQKEREILLIPCHQKIQASDNAILFVEKNADITYFKHFKSHFFKTFQQIVDMIENSFASVSIPYEIENEIFPKKILKLKGKFAQVNLNQDSTKEIESKLKNVFDHIIIFSNNLENSLTMIKFLNQEDRIVLFTELILEKQLISKLEGLEKEILAITGSFFNHHHLSLIKIEMSKNLVILEDKNNKLISLNLYRIINCEYNARNFILRIQSLSQLKFLDLKPKNKNEKFNSWGLSQAGILLTNELLYKISGNMIKNEILFSFFSKINDENIDYGFKTVKITERVSIFFKIYGTLIWYLMKLRPRLVPFGVYTIKPTENNKAFFDKASKLKGHPEIIAEIFLDCHKFTINPSLNQKLSPNDYILFFVDKGKIK